MNLDLILLIEFLINKLSLLYLNWIFFMMKIIENILIVWLININIKKINLNTQNNFNKIDSNYNNYDKKRIKWKKRLRYFSCD